jgi:hypothetical protein
VKVNKSDIVVDADNTGHAFTASSSQQRVTGVPFPTESFLSFSEQTRLVSGVFITGTGETLTRYDHPGAQTFNRNPPPIAGIARQSAQAAKSVLERAASYTVGTSTKQFWVEDENSAWIEIDTTLCATGTHSNIWVADVNFDNSSTVGTDNKITEVQAQALAAKFDDIYGFETPVFGYEYGGGPAPSYPGGVDGDPKIQILVYDIDYDYSPTSTGGTFGYFWSKDFYDQASLGEYYMTNKAEMFYIDAYFTDSYPDAAYLTLAHEFQHMINFNEKVIRLSTGTATVTYDTWYDEMLSMLAEDTIGPLIGIPPSNPAHVTPDRMRFFLAGYQISGIKDWLPGNDLLYSYASVYAFGAYLVRNFGGAALVKAMMKSNTTNEASIDTALASLHPDMTFKKALSRYGEALVYSGPTLPDGVLSFDKTVTTQISGTDYTFTGFDIWNMPNIMSGQPITVGTPPNVNTCVFPEKGPMVWPSLAYVFDLRGNSVILQSADDWQGVTGSLVITARKPVNPDVELYLMVR